MMNITTVITDFLSKARYKLALITSEMDSFEDTGDVFYAKLQTNRIELSEFCDILEENQQGLVDGTHWLYTAGWTDGMILTEIHHLSDKFELSKLLPLPYEPIDPIMRVDYTVRYFIELLDTPSGYEGQALKLVRVKEDESGLEFANPVSIVRPDAQIGDGVQTRFVFVNSVTYGIDEVLIVSVGGVVQAKANYKVISVNSVNDSILFFEPPLEGAEVVLEYFMNVPNLAPINNTTATVEWGDILGTLEHQTDLWLALSENKPIIKENVEVTGVGTVGGYSDGDIIAENTTLTDFVKGLLIKRIPPTYVQPSISLSIVPTAIQEVGDFVSITLTPSYVQHDGGIVMDVNFYKNNNLIHNQGNLDAYHLVDTSSLIENVQYKVEINYAAGPIKNDNLGNPDPTGKIEAGVGSSIKNLAFNLYNWFGEGNPSTGNDVRTLNKSFNNTFTLNTGTTGLHMTVAIPDGKHIVSIIDIDALNADLTADYIYNDILTEVPDGGGTNKAYKIYTLSIATPYSSNHRHNVTLA